MRLTIRADGGSEIGYGHLVRTGALAAELLERGHRVTYATTSPDTVETVCPDGVGIVELPARDDPEPVVEHVTSDGVDAVFTDAYSVDTAYQRAVRDHVPLAVHQDDARHAVCADLFFNWNLYGPDLDYEFVGEWPRTCLGSDYVLLRSAVREFAMRDPPWRDEPERAVVTMGGSDVAGLTPVAVRAFGGTDVRVEAVVGPGCSAEQVADVEAVSADTSAAIEVVQDPRDLPERLFHADLAVTTAGSTVYELMALGTPFVSRPVVDNQAPIARALQACDAAMVLDWDAGETAISVAIENYMDAPENRREHRDRGRSLVDGRGTERVAGEVLSLAGSNEET